MADDEAPSPRSSTPSAVTGRGRRPPLARWRQEGGKAWRRLRRHGLAIAAWEPTEAVRWRLPPSKSHGIRWLALAAQGSGRHRMMGVAGHGLDLEAMLRMVEQLGVGVERAGDAWIITGVGPDGLRRPASLLHAANSGTALRLAAGLVARLPGPIMLDGDASLRRRGLAGLETVLRDLQVTVQRDEGPGRLPILLDGPWQGGEVSLDVATSSQPLSALIIGSPGLVDAVQLRMVGEPVSRAHAGLSARLAAACGWSGELDHEAGELLLEGWTPDVPDEFIVPADASHAAFAVLLARALRTEVHAPRWPAPDDALGCDLLFEQAADLGLSVTADGGGLRWSPGPGPTSHVTIDLRDANDLLVPLAATLALAGGGRLHGAAHARHKESDRTHRGAELLAAFGLHATVHDDGLEVQGSQHVAAPEAPVATHGDHRLQMTATILALVAGGVVEGPRLHEVTDPAWLDRLTSAGADIEPTTW